MQIKSKENFKVTFLRRPDRKKRVSETLPKQAMSVEEIVDRFVKNLPVNIVKREPVFLDQDELDLEKVARMDFAEKKDLADSYGAKAESIERDWNERKRAREEAEEPETEQPEPSPKKASKKSSKTAPEEGADTGIE